MRKILVAGLLLPLVAAAQGGPGPGTGAAQGGASAGGPGMGAGRGNGQGARGMGPSRGDPERMERRMRLARTLGLAEALDLEPAQALRLGDQVAKFDDRRLALHKQLRDAHDTLRRAASGEKVTAADVDGAIQRALDARAQMQALDREMVTTVTKDLAPEKRARAVLFLERFHRRFGGPGPGREVRMERRMRTGAGGGIGHGPGPGPGPGPRMGMGSMGEDGCAEGDCGFEDEPGDD